MLIGSTRKRSATLGVFEFVLLMVLISTIGKVLSDRRARPELPGSAHPLPPAELEAMREAMDDLGARLGRLEEERDFYRDLLESPERPLSIRPPTMEGRGPGDP